MLLSILLLTAIMLVAVVTPPGEPIIRRILSAEISKAVGRPVMVGHFSTDLFSKISLANVRTQPPDPALRIDTISVQYDLAGLFAKKIRIRSILIDGLSFDVRRDRGKKFNLPILDSIAAAAADTARVETAKVKSAWVIRLDSAVVRNVHLSYTDDAAHIRLHVDRFGASVHATPDEQGYRFTMELPEGMMQAGASAEEPLRIHAGGIINGPLVHLDRCELEATALDVRISGDFPLDSAGTIGATVDASGNPSRLITLVKSFLPAGSIPPIRFESAFHLSVRAGGMRSNPSIAGRLEFPKVVYRTIMLDGGFANASFARKTLVVDSAKLNISGGTIRATARLPIDSNSTRSLSVTIDRLPLRPLMTAVQKSTLPITPGQLSGTISFRGIMNRPAGWFADADILLQKSFYGYQSLPDIRLSASLDSGAGTLALRSALAMVKAQGTIDNNARNILGSFDATIDSLGKVAHLIDTSTVTGHVLLSGKFSGPIKHPDIDLHVQGGDVRYRNVPLDTLDGNISYDGRNFTIGSILFAGQQDPIDQAAPPFGVDSLAGSFRYSGSLHGTLQNPEGGITANIFGHPGYKLYRFDSLAILLDLTGQKRIRIGRLEIAKDSMRMEGTGEYSLSDSTGRLGLQFFANNTLAGDTGTIGTEFTIHPKAAEADVRVKGRRLDIALIDRFVTDSVRSSGEVSFDATFKGTALHPDLSLTFQGDSMRYRGAKVDSLRIRDVRLQDQDLRIGTVAVGMGQNRFIGNARMRLLRDSTGRLTIGPKSYTSGTMKVPMFNLTALEPFMPEQVTARGRMALDVHWDGTIGDPHPQGTLRADSLSYQSKPTAKPIELNTGRITLTDSLLRIDTVAGRMQGLPFFVTGSVISDHWKSYTANISASVEDLAGHSGGLLAKGTYSPKSINFSADIQQMNLTLFQSVAPSLDSLGGILAMHAEITGSSTDARIHGSLEIRNLLLQPSMLDRPFTDGVVKASFAGADVTLDSLWLRKEGGSVFATGRVTQRGGAIENLDVRVSADKLPLANPDLFDARVDSLRLSYSHTATGPYILGGDIYLGPSVLLASPDPKSFLPSRRVRRASPGYPEFLAQTRLSVRLHGGDSLWVDNNFANLQLHVETGVIGLFPQPNLTGRVAIDTGGSVLYLDRKFTVTEGTFDFIDPNKLNPDIALTARSIVTTYEGTSPTDYQITLSIKGPLDKVQTSLTSDPPLEQPDIVALLTVGATREQITGNGSATGVVAERAAALTTGKVAGYAAHQLSNALGLDQVSVKGNLLRLGEQGGPQLVATKTLSERTRVTYTTTVGQISAQTVQVDYRLSPFFFLEGKTNDRAEASISLKYSLRFR